MNDKELILSTIALQVQSCKLCSLFVTRTNPVPGVGSFNASVMFVGEGPGANEDLKGLPFVGAAGQLLDKLLNMIGLNRKDVFITNIVKCRPPGNRTPLEEEINSCKPYLFAQIATISPKVIVTLGSPSTQTMLGKNTAISVAHGRLQNKDGIKFMPMYHPAAYLHKRSPDLLEDMKNDFKELHRIIEQIK